MEETQRDLASPLVFNDTATTEILQEEELQGRLDAAEKRGVPLKVKLGVDPSRPDLHIGHGVVLRKLRQFQDLGHQVVLVIGDFTGRVGDPSGRSTSRPQLSEAEVDRNAATYLAQVGRVLDPEKTEIRRNSEWLGPLDLGRLIRLMGTFTVARMLEREDFQRRFQEARPIHLHEFAYPLMQGYDSVALEADVEIGGMDQKFNLIAARHIQREWGQTAEVAVLMPLLVGLDGVEKMSKSLGNDVAVDLPPEEMFGRLMSVTDEMIVPYLELAAGAPPETVTRLAAGLADGTIHPRLAKAEMARAVVRVYWGADSATRAAEAFDARFSRRDLTGDLPEVALPASMRGLGRVRVVRLLVEVGLAPSAAEARRLIAAGAVELDDERPRDAEAEWTPRDGAVVRVGRHRFARMRVGP